MVRPRLAAIRAILRWTDRDGRSQRVGHPGRPDHRGQQWRPAWLVRKLAWAHDAISDPTLNVSFIGLPTAGFAVNGATPAHNLALLTGGAEWRSANGVSLLEVRPRIRQPVADLRGHGADQIRVVRSD